MIQGDFAVRLSDVEITSDSDYTLIYSTESVNFWIYGMREVITSEAINTFSQGDDGHFF